MTSHPCWWSTVTDCFWRPQHVISIATSGLVMDAVKLFPQTVGQDSKVLLPVSTPAKSGGDFTTQAVQDTLFCFVKKKIISTVTGMWMRCCSRQRGPYGHGCASGSSAEMCMSSSKSSWCGNATRLALFILEKAVHSNNKDKDFEYFLEFINYVNGVRTFGQVFLTFRSKLKCF